VVSAFAAGFDIAALVLFAAVAAALMRYDRVAGTGYRLAAARARMVVLGAAVFAAVNSAAVVEMLLALRTGAGAVDAPPSALAHGATAAMVVGALAWHHARRDAERAFDAQLVRLTRE
jgi:hypothetical protein